MSLPPSGADSDTPASIVPASDVPPTEKKPYWYRDKTSKAYDQAMRVFAMRAAGIDDTEIAKVIGIGKQSLWNLCYLAGRNGWVSEQLASAKDVVEFQILPKALRRIEEGLDDDHRNEKTGMQVKTLVALKVTEGTVFKKFEQQSSIGGQSNLIAIRIENIPGPPQQMREGTVSGTAAYIDGEVANVVGLDAAAGEPAVPVRAEVGKGR